MKKPKEFDCVRFKDELQARLMREYKGLTDEQIRRRRARKLATSQTPIAKLWRKLQARDKKPTEALADARKGGRQRERTVFGQIKAGLEDSIAYSRGQLSLVTTEPPPPPPELSRAEIAALRKRLKMSQAFFAAVLNVSAKAVQSWEQGIRRPSDAALRMLQVIERQPSVVRSITTKAAGPRRAATRSRRSRSTV